LFFRHIFSLVGIERASFFISEMGRSLVHMILMALIRRGREEMFGRTPADPCWRR
jgi:hypothetical protein